MEAIATVDQLFMRYATVGQVIAQMLSAAREENWDTVVELQARYSALVDTLRPVDAGFELDEPQNARKQEFIRRILSSESAIREMAATRMARVSALLASGRQTRALHQTYGLSSRR